MLRRSSDGGRTRYQAKPRERAVWLLFEQQQNYGRSAEATMDCAFETIFAN